MLKKPFIFILYSSTDSDCSEPINENNKIEPIIENINIEPINETSGDSSSIISDSFIVPENLDTNLDSLSLDDKEKLDFFKESKKIKDKFFNLKLNEQLTFLALGLGIGVVSLGLIILLYRLLFQRKFY